MSYRSWILPIRYRILFHLYSNPSISKSELKLNFQSNELLEFQSIFQSLLQYHAIEYINQQYTCNPQSEPFIHILNYIFTSKEPLTKEMIRSKVNHRNLNEILELLIRSGIIYEYRAELCRKNFVLPFLHKDTLIAKINSNIQTKLENSPNMGDQSHLLMLKNNASILSYTNDQLINVLKLTKNELKLLVNLYVDVESKNRRTIGKTVDEITKHYFAEDIKKSEKTILGLVKKGIIQCSYKHYYFINNSLYSQIKPLFNDHKDLIVKEEDDINGKEKNS